MQQAHHVRLDADDAGESHMEELDISLATVDFAPPAGPLNVGQFFPAAHSDARSLLSYKVRSMRWLATAAYAASARGWPLDGGYVRSLIHI